MNTLNNTLKIQHPKGTGTDKDDDNFGSLVIRFTNVGITVQTGIIMSLDSATVIADKIELAFQESDSFKEHFVYERVGNKFTIQTIFGGKKYNGNIILRRLQRNNLVTTDDIFTSRVTNLTGGEDYKNDLSLEPYTDYWYTVRFRYRDGYLTPTVNPQLVNTGESKGVQIVVDTEEKDIDGTRPKLQIFRRKEGGPFQLIDEIQPQFNITTYNDVGAFAKDSLDEQVNIFTKTHTSQDLIENRYVRANVEYFQEDYTPGTYVISTESVADLKAQHGESFFDLYTEDKTIPENTKAIVYVRPTYEDGSKGYFTQIGETDVTTSDKKLKISQSALAENEDKDISELGFFVNYRPLSEEFSFSFNSPELANKNMPTIGNSSFFPTRTRVFFGFKYIELWDVLSNIHTAVKVFGWDAGENIPMWHGGFTFGRLRPGAGEGPTAFNGTFPRKLTIQLFGNEFTYVRIAAKSADGGSLVNKAVYKLDMFDSLQQAVQTGKLRLRLKGSTVNNLSSSKTERELFDKEVKVTGLIDASTQYNEYSILSEDDPSLIGPADTRIYLELEESPLDEIDNTSVTRYDYYTDYKALDGPKDLFDGVPTKSNDVSRYSLSFELMNFKMVANEEFKPYTGSASGADNGRAEILGFGRTAYIYEWDHADYHLIDFDLLDLNTVIYLGSKVNEPGTVTFDYTGYEFKKNNDLYYSRLEESNIYSNVILQKDITGEVQFKNQLVWSEPVVLGNKLAGGRRFDIANFLNISSENGEIVKIVASSNNLYVFCEKGVALVNVGEILTSQKSGQVFIDSSDFLSSYYWLSTEFADIKRDSIVRVKDQILFTDGYDVFQISNRQIQNISSGVVELEPEREYAATIDIPNYEYKLSDIENGDTWIYNLEFGQWYGPFTYVTTKGASNKNIVISQIGGDLVKHNVGNTFNGQTYDTLIQSVANDTDESSIDKRYRKFYLDVDGTDNAVFKYGKDPDNMRSIAMSAMREKNGEKNQGVSPRESNSKVIFWDIETQDEGFELRDFSWSYQPTRRR